MTAEEAKRRLRRCGRRTRQESIGAALLVDPILLSFGLGFLAGWRPRTARALVREAAGCLQCFTRR